MACSITSGPMPSPPITATRKTVIACTPLCRYEDKQQSALPPRPATRQIGKTRRSDAFVKVGKRSSPSPCAGPDIMNQARTLTLVLSLALLPLGLTGCLGTPGEFGP